MTNCLFFAVALWFRRWRRGRGAQSYICIRLSRVPWGLIHVLYGRLDKDTDQIKVVSYKPDASRKAGLEVVFKGHVARGDIPPSELD